MRPKSRINRLNHLGNRLQKLGIPSRWSWGIVAAYGAIDGWRVRMSKRLFFLRPSRWAYWGRPGWDWSKFAIRHSEAGDLWVVFAGFEFNCRKTPKVPLCWTFDPFEDDPLIQGDGLSG